MLFLYFLMYYYCGTCFVEGLFYFSLVFESSLRRKVDRFESLRISKLTLNCLRRIPKSFIFERK